MSGFPILSSSYAFRDLELDPDKGTATLSPEIPAEAADTGSQVIGATWDGHAWHLLLVVATEGGG